MLSLFKSKQTPAATAALPAATPDAPTPIRVMNPEPAALSMLRNMVVVGTSKPEVMVALSPSPSDEWRAAFQRYWKQFYPSVAVPLFTGNYLILASEPFRLRSMVEIARVVAYWTNTFAAPLIAGNAAHAKLGRKRADALAAFDYEPFPLPDIGTYIEGTIPRAEFDAQREQLGQRAKAVAREKKAAELAAAEADAVIASLESLPPA